MSEDSKLPQEKKRPSKLVFSEAEVAALAAAARDDEKEEGGGWPREPRINFSSQRRYSFD